MVMASSGMVSSFGGLSTGFGNVMGDIESQYKEALAANEKRYSQAMAIYDEIINRYQPGGGFGKSALAQLEEQKKRDVGKETQAQISSGLFGTSATAGLGTKWEKEVGAPSRLKLEDIMMERLSQAQLGKAGFIERREDIYPDVGMAAQYASQGGAPTIASGGGPVGGPSYMRMYGYGGATDVGSGGTGTAPGAQGGGGTTGPGGTGTAPGAQGGAGEAEPAGGPTKPLGSHPATPATGYGIPEGWEVVSGTIAGIKKGDFRWAGPGKVLVPTQKKRGGWAGMNVGAGTTAPTPSGTMYA